MRNRNLGYERQHKDFYPTPAWVTEVLLNKITLPKTIWEPCCGNGAMAKVMEAAGHQVVCTDLVDRGYGTPERDFFHATAVPDGVTAIVTNPPYGRQLYRFVDHALELTRPVGGMVALLLNLQWIAGEANSARLDSPAYHALVSLNRRIYWFEATKSPQENHCWVVWDWSRKPGPAFHLRARTDPNARSCIACQTPLPSDMRADARVCSATCRQRAHRRGL